MPTPSLRISRMWHTLFEGGVSQLIFEHARNLVVATLVLAAGLEAIEHDPREMGILYFKSAGYAVSAVSAVGVALVRLNLLQGLHHLSKARLQRAWQTLLVAAYVVLFWRVVHLILLFR